MSEIVFTDRYGSSGPPSWLRGCHGPCEAMGFYPVQGHAPDRLTHDAVMVSDPLTAREQAAVDAMLRAGKRQADGWYFIPCPECGGTGRVSWRRAIARIPRWFVKGCRLIRQKRGRRK